jgi:hypothetical protein
MERIGRLAYRLDILSHEHIHNIFSVAMLEPSPVPGSDPFNVLYLLSLFLLPKGE